MKAIQVALLSSIFALSTAFANDTKSEDISSAETTVSVQMNSQQELVDIFFAAAKTGNQDVINEYLKYGFPVDIRNAQGYTPLMMAAYYGQQEVVSTLLANGADRCARDNKGNTALMGAMFKLEWGVVKQLRKVDCDTQAAKTGQKTVAEFAKVIGQDKRYNALKD